jgi:hypothetical protein
MLWIDEEICATWDICKEEWGENFIDLGCGARSLIEEK